MKINNQDSTNILYSNAEFFLDAFKLILYKNIIFEEINNQDAI